MLVNMKHDDCWFCYAVPMCHGLEEENLLYANYLFSKLYVMLQFAMQTLSSKFISYDWQVASKVDKCVWHTFYGDDCFKQVVDLIYSPFELDPQVDTHYICGWRTCFHFMWLLESSLCKECCKLLYSELDLNSFMLQTTNELIASIVQEPLPTYPLKAEKRTSGPNVKNSRKMSMIQLM